MKEISAVEGSYSISSSGHDVVHGGVSAVPNAVLSGVFYSEVTIVELRHGQASESRNSVHPFAGSNNWNRDSVATAIADLREAGPSDPALLDGQGAKIVLRDTGRRLHDCRVGDSHLFYKLIRATLIATST